MPLYLLHGALGSASQLEPLASKFVDARVVEFAGHGNTPLDARPFALDTFVAQLDDRLQSDGAKRVDLFGYSMGGYVALAFVLRFPERVKSIFTLGTKFEWTPDTAAREASRLDADRIRAKVPQFAEQLERRHAGAGGWQGTLASTAHFLRELGDNPALGAAELARIAAPVCIGTGDRDATVGVEESARVSRQLGNGSLAVLPKTPHPFEQVNHSLLADLLKHFVSEHD
ncbi:MAG: alpha/beta fold hydrolase [bacterium]